MKSININQNKSGVTMFFVLMFMIIASLLGSSLMYLSSKQSDIGGDYFAKKTAEDAAESALDWFQGAVEDFTIDDTTKLNSVVKWINNFDNNSLNNRWFTVKDANSSTETTFLTNDIKNNFTSATEDDADYITINGKTIKAKLRIENVDRINSVVVVKAIGYGVSNSKKTLRGVYKLEGAFDNSFNIYDTTEILDPLLEHAYYTDSDVKISGGSVFDIAGNNVYFGESSTFHGEIRVSGNLKVMGNMNIPGSGGGFVNGNLYVQGNLNTQNGSVSLEVGTAADASYCFIEGSYLLYSGCGFKSHTNTYLGAFTQNQSETEINGNLYIKEKKYGEITSGVNVSKETHIGYSHSDGDKLDKKLNSQDGVTWDYEGFPKADDIVSDDDIEDNGLHEETIDIDVASLTSNASFSLNGIVNEIKGGDNNFKNNSFTFTADNVNDLYEKGTTTIAGKVYPADGNPLEGWSENSSEKFKETNGVLVIDFDAGNNALAEQGKFGDGSLNPGVKVALAVNGNYPFKGKSFWSAPDPSSALGIFCNPTEDNDNVVGTFSEFKSKDVINGMFYSNSASRTDYVNEYPNQFTGAVIVKGQKLNYNSWLGADGESKSLEIKYNDDVVRLFGGINGSNGSIFMEPDGSHTEVEQWKVDSTYVPVQSFSTTVIKPKLISKY